MARQEFIRGLNSLKPHHRECVATIGSFDGVHLGHQKILASLKAKSQSLGLPSVVIVFEPQPHEYFARSEAPARLTRLREKVDALFVEGIDRVLCLRFDILRSLIQCQHCCLEIDVKLFLLHRHDLKLRIELIDY